VSAKHELRLLLGWSDIRTALSLDRLLAVGAISFGGGGGLGLSPNYSLSIRLVQGFPTLVLVSESDISFKRHYLENGTESFWPPWDGKMNAGILCTVPTSIKNNWSYYE